MDYSWCLLFLISTTNKIRKNGKKQSVRHLESLCFALHQINIGYQNLVCVLHLIIIKNRNTAAVYSFSFYYVIRHKYEWQDKRGQAETTYYSDTYICIKQEKQSNNKNKISVWK